MAFAGNAMNAAGVDAILHEARLLATHALRTGALPPDSRLFEEIDSVARKRERGEYPDIAPLAVETKRVSDAAGVTVEQLARRHTPLGRWRWAAARATPFLIGFMTLLLTLYLAFQSSELHKADLALREYQGLMNERLPEKIYLAWKMYRYEDVLNSKGPPLAQLDGYQKLVDDAKRLHEKRGAVRQLLTDSSLVRYVPAVFQDHGPDWLQRFAQVVNSAPVNDYSAIPQISDPDPSIPCEKSATPSVTRVKTGTSSTRLDLDDYEHAIDCFLQSLRISDYGYPMDIYIYTTRNKVQLLVSWLLPGLYGLLGACVFVMRGLLHSSGPAGGDARIVDLLSLLLRVSLGGLAGIIIGWFSVPSALSPTSSSIAVSSIPFGIAFLAGYSIEGLFSLLDRLNRTLGQSQDDGSVPRSDRPRTAGSELGR